MAKREISSTLRNLKFMQRATLKKEDKKNDEEPNGNFTSLGTVPKKCVVITDWNPQPEALLGRMSFQSFNPSIEKLSEPESSKVEPSGDSNGDLKRKQSEILMPEEQNYPNKSPRTLESSNNNSPPKSNKNGKAFKKPKGRKGDWSVLEPLKRHTKKG